MPGFGDMTFWQFDDNTGISPRQERDERVPSLHFQLTDSEGV
jgi:hypothetical protein